MTWSCRRYPDRVHQSESSLTGARGGRTIQSDSRSGERSRRRTRSGAAFLQGQGRLQHRPRGACGCTAGCGTPQASAHSPEAVQRKLTLYLMPPADAQVCGSVRATVRSSVGYISEPSKRPRNSRTADGKERSPFLSGHLLHPPTHTTSTDHLGKCTRTRLVGILQLMLNLLAQQWL